MKVYLLSLVVLFAALQLGFTQSGFPTGPNPKLTPGALCQRPDSYRYPEGIPYCNRSVSTDVKNRIIQTYDQVLGYRIQQMDRQDFKIDHLIPLCAGGSNDVENLWPQHRSVYKLTDFLDQEACVKMAEGKLKQADAVKLILKAKLNLNLVPAVLQQLNLL